MGSEPIRAPTPTAPPPHHPSKPRPMILTFTTRLLVVYHRTQQWPRGNRDPGWSASMVVGNNRQIIWEWRHLRASNYQRDQRDGWAIIRGSRWLDPHQRPTPPGTLDTSGDRRSSSTSVTLCPSKEVGRDLGRRLQPPLLSIYTMFLTSLNQTTNIIDT